MWITGNHEGLLRNLLSLYKFGHQRAAAEPIARQMADTLLAISGYQRVAQKNYLVVAVPTATSRIRERGFGHAELLARKVSRVLRLEQSNVLGRSGQTRQVGAARQDRLRQLHGVFSVRTPRKVAGRNILLIDDVVTTGGTIMAATKALRSAGAGRVDALLFAKRL